MSEIIEVKVLDVSTVTGKEKDVNAILVIAQECVIKNQGDLEIVNVLMKEAKSKYRFFEAERKKLKSPVDLAGKAIQALFKPLLSPLLQAETIYKNKMVDYENNQAEIRRKAEEKLRVEAEKEEERKRKAIEKQIENAKKKGNEEKVEILEQKKEEVFVPTPILPPAPKTEGISYIEKWKGEVTDFSKLSDKFKTVNQSDLNRVAQATKGQQPEPGVRWVMHKEARSR